MFKLGCILFCAVLFALPAPGAEDALAKVTGIVELGPAPRERRSAQRYADVDRAQLGEAAPRVAIVFATPLDQAPPLPRQPETAVMWQRGLHFHPRTLPIVIHTPVRFPNADETYHNVFSYSKPKRFDLGRYLPDDEAPVVVFDEPGEIRLFCDVHEHMRASILVLETPYFVSTDAEGRFELTDLPPGRYRLEAWVDPRRQHEAELTLAPGETRTLNLPE